MTVPAERLDQEFFALAEMGGRHGRGRAQPGARPRRRAAHLPDCRRPHQQGRRLRRQPFPAERGAARLQGVPGRRQPRSLRQVQARPGPVPALSTGPRPFTPKTPPTWWTARWWPSFRYRRSARRTCARTFKKAGAAPHILIVTDKLLTGYDTRRSFIACSLDSAMRDHVAVVLHGSAGESPVRGRQRRPQARRPRGRFRGRAAGIEKGAAIRFVGRERGQSKISTC